MSNIRKFKSCILSTCSLFLVFQLSLVRSICVVPSTSVSSTSSKCRRAHSLTTLWLLRECSNHKVHRSTYYSSNRNMSNDTLAQPWVLEPLLRTAHAPFVCPSHSSLPFISHHVLVCIRVEEIHCWTWAARGSWSHWTLWCPDTMFKGSRCVVEVVDEDSQFLTALAE